MSLKASCIRGCGIACSTRSSSARCRWSRCCMAQWSAAAFHLRVAERSTYYALPEGSRGIFLGGGGSMRLPRLIGVSRVMELMLTGCTYDAEQGQTFGLSHVLVDDGAGLAKGIELAERVATNAPLSNFAVMHVLPRIAESDPASGLLTESLMAAIAQGSDDAKA